MRITWCMGWMAMFQAAMLIAAVTIFSVPQLVSPNGGSDPGIHTADRGGDTNATPKPLHQPGNHCHSDLECSVQTTLGARHDAQIRPADLRLLFQFVNISMAGLVVAFDPPPPRRFS